MRVKPLQDFVLVEKIVHNKTALDLDMSQVRDTSMFDVRVVELGPDVTVGCKPEDLVELVQGNMAVPVPGMSGEHYIVKQRDIIGVWSVV